MAKDTSVARAFIDTIGFTNISSLSQDDLDAYDFRAMAGAQAVMVMPDVRSLHIFVKEPDGSFWHQILDYPYDDEDFDYWIDWWLESYEGNVEGETLEDVATNGGFYRISKKATFTIAEIRAAYDRIKKARESLPGA